LSGKPPGVYATEEAYGREFEPNQAKLEGYWLRRVELTVGRTFNVVPLLVRASISLGGRGSTVHLVAQRPGGEEIEIVVGGRAPPG